ncbi:excinuclease ABC subunit UvrC [archaeon]|nr:excinuclease ABC subunit UvrC [archaeon]
MFNSKIRNAPKQSGVYLMKDKKSSIIYIGKAKNIRNRIKSYFAKTATHDPKVSAMVQHIKDIDFIITGTEKEALILEAELVRKHRPKYNIDLKDDKAYPYITLTVSDRYPRMIISRRNLSKKDLHFGPYANSVIRLITLLRKIFRIRDCKTKNLPKKICISYQLKRCSGPCEKFMTEDEYQQNINQAKRFLSGDIKGVIDDIEKSMKDASKKHDFESAAIYRDQLAQLKLLVGRQSIVSQKKTDTDVIGSFSNTETIVFNIVFVRNGTVTGTRHYLFDKGLEQKDMLSGFLKQYYLRHGEFVPKEIIAPFPFDDKDLIQEWLSDSKDRKVVIAVPKRGEKLKLLEMSDRNAKEAYLQHSTTEKDSEEKLECLKEELGLKKAPKVIEAFDISTIGGQHSVGSMVQFRDGKPDKSNYRKFRIKTVDNIDDFAMMREVITRRYTRLKKESKEMPDLILVDGGKGQLSIALDVLKELNIRNQPIISLAKREEEIYLPNREKPIVLKKDSKALLLLRHIRDESHRFAISYHKLLRKKGFEK